MPIDYPNFRQLRAEDVGGLGGFDLGEAIKTGLENSRRYQQAKYEPRNLENEAIEKEYANKMKQPYADNAERVFNADIGAKEGETGLIPFHQKLLKAQADRQAKLANDPYGGHIPTGDVAQAYWLDKIRKEEGENSPYYKNAMKLVDAGVAAKQATKDRNIALTNSQAFRMLPINEKSRAISTAVGMGYDPVEAGQLMQEGRTLEDLAKAKDVELKDVIPVPPLSNETIKQNQQRSAFVNEIKSLEKNINAATGEYGRKFLGYSPKQVWDAISNKDPETQGMFLAARALQPELAALRLKSMGGQVGIEAIREVQDKALAEAKILESAVSPEARLAMNKYITNWIEQAQDAYSNRLSDYARLGQGPQLRSNLEKAAQSEKDPFRLGL